MLPGGMSDLNDNGFVDFEDLTILLANWNQDVGSEQGNIVLPEDTVVNFEDLTVLLADWTGPGPAASPEAALGASAVPEPSTFLLAAIAMLGALQLADEGSVRWQFHVQVTLLVVIWTMLALGMLLALQQRIFPRWLKLFSTAAACFAGSSSSFTSSSTPPTASPARPFGPRPGCGAT